jgi:chromosome segregation ATPase
MEPDVSDAALEAIQARAASPTASVGASAELLFSSPLSIASLEPLRDAESATPSGPSLALLQARSNSTASLAALSAHAAQLETALRAQASAVARAEAARTDALAQQATLTHEVATLTHERQRLATSLEQCAQRCDGLLVERSLAVKQCADVARALATERTRARAETAQMQTQVRSLEESLGEKAAACAASEQQNAALVADLREVTSLIDQLEGQPGFVRGRVRLRSSPAVGAAVSVRAVDAAAAEAGALRVHVAVLRASLSESEREAASVAACAVDAAEAPRLREENAVLENQLELLSEKMYGSPAKSAARERDRMQIELERERGSRLVAEEDALGLHAQLERAHARVAQLEGQLAAEESARADLERTRRALHAAQTNAALGLMGKNLVPAPVREPPRHVYNPIAAPRHQFGLQPGRGIAATGSGPTGAGAGGRATPTLGGSSGGRSSSTPRTRAPILR